jgi:hypothetical protein
MTRSAVGTISLGTSVRPDVMVALEMLKSAMTALTPNADERRSSSQPS